MQALDWLTIAVVLGSGTAGGIFFTFSNFVMPALARLPKAQGVAAMQQINITVINPLALGVMLGTGLITLAAAVGALLNRDGGAPWLLIGSALVYLIGCIGVTILGNVPLNDRLAKVVPETDEAQSLWDHYLTRWTFWNTARTLACLLTCAGSAIALHMS